MNRKVEIAEIILAEFDSFKENFKPQKLQAIGTEKAFNSFVKPATNAIEVTKFNEAQQSLEKEPFIAYLKVLERDIKDGQEVNPRESIYLVNRYGNPSIEPKTSNAKFIVRHSYLGKVASAEIDEDNDYVLRERGIPRKTIRVKILEKTEFDFEEWDAINNKFYFDEHSEIVFSLRELIESCKTGNDVHIATWKRFSKSFGLKDRAILDKTQDNFCRLPLSSQLILTGFPGTGKTTTLIKRISFKSNAEHLAETDTLTLDSNELDNWIIFTPNELLRTYLKEAMNKEGLLANSIKVKVWHDERISLGRDVLKFLRIGDKGIFTRINTNLLNDINSSGLISYFKDFNIFFVDSVKKTFQDNRNDKEVVYSKLLPQIPIIYKRFRQKLLQEKSNKILNYDFEKEINEDKISDHEIDIIIYLMLKIARNIFQKDKELLSTNSKFQILENIKFQYKTQINVDEATDFSIIQLGCIYNLSHPNYSSVTFVGDLMQRVTDFGLLEWDECNKFISPKFEKYELSTPYRQTPVLLHIASKLYKSITNETPTLNLRFYEDERTPQPLKFQTINTSELANWFIQRILEMYEINNFNLPSIAVFVPEGKEHIDSIYEMIQPKLSEHSIEIEKCYNDKILSEESKVRIFNIEFIKGLEFEAAFFMNIDEFKDQNLIDKYLYVGLTRAKTFLGITYKSNFPESIKGIENDFVSGSWAEFIS